MRQHRCEVVVVGAGPAEGCERLDLPEGSMIDTVRRARFISPSGVEVIYEPGKPLAKVVDRTRFARALAARAAEAGVTFIRGWTACGVEKAGNELTIALRTGRQASRPASRIRNRASSPTFRMRISRPRSSTAETELAPVFRLGDSLWQGNGATGRARPQSRASALPEILDTGTDPSAPSPGASERRAGADPGRNPQRDPGPDPEPGDRSGR